MVHTPRQLAGRGQDGRRWLSPTGVFTASFVVELADPTAGSRLSLAAGLAVAHLVEDLAPRARVAIKWPNDCYCHDRKLAGILCEARLRGGVLRAVVGIGLNVDPRWDETHRVDELERPPIALAELGCTDPGPDRLIDGLRGYLLQAVGLLRAARWEPLAQQLRERDWLHGRPLRVDTRDGGPVYGSGAGIDQHGRLLLALGDGRLRAIGSGRVWTAAPASTSTPAAGGAQ